MRISDWSSDVCSSDLPCAALAPPDKYSRNRQHGDCQAKGGNEDAIGEPKNLRHVQAVKPPVDCVAGGFGVARQQGGDDGSCRGVDQDAGCGTIIANVEGTADVIGVAVCARSEGHTSELQSLMR